MELHFSKIVNYIQEKRMCQSEIEVSFEVAELEGLYAELLDFDNIPYTSHVSRFADRLVSEIPGLEKRVIGKVFVVFSDDINNIVLEDTIKAESYVKSLLKLISPIRKEMADINNEFNATFSKTCQQDSLPLKLLILVSMLVDGVHEKGFSQSTLSAAQCIMYNFRKKVPMWLV